MASSEILRYTRVRDGEVFVIIANPQEVDDRTGYSLAFTIGRKVGGEWVEKGFNAANTFPTEDEAVEGCFEAGRMIIDGKVPELSDEFQ